MPYLVIIYTTKIILCSKIRHKTEYRCLINRNFAPVTSPNWSFFMGGVRC